MRLPLCQCLIILWIYSLIRAEPIHSKSFNYSKFTASLWFRVMEQQHITNTNILEIASVDEISQNPDQYLMSIYTNNQGKNLLMILESLKYIFNIEQQDDWLHLVISNERLYGYFTITLESQNSPQQFFVEQSVQSLSYVHFIFQQSSVEFDHTQIDTLDNKLTFACQPGCQQCTQQNLFQCFNCEKNRIRENINQSCKCANSFTVVSSQCLNKQYSINRYMNQLFVIKNMFKSEQHISNCQENHSLRKIDLNTGDLDLTFNFFMQYENDKKLNIIYFQIDPDSPMNLQEDRVQNQLIDWNSSCIFYLSSQNNIGKLNFQQSSFQVQNINVINQVKRPSCMNQTINFTMINMSMNNVTLNQMVFSEDIDQLQIFNLTIKYSHIEVENLFNSKQLLLMNFKLINCTIINSILFKAKFITIINAKIENCSFVNSGIIKGQLETLIMNHISLQLITINSNLSILHVWGAINIQIHTFEYRQISNYVGAIAIDLSGSHIELINITISNQNITNYPIYEIISIVSQMILISNISFEYIYGSNNRPLLLIQSQDNESIYNITQLNINYIHIEGKIRNLIEIKSGSKGQTFIDLLIIKNLLITNSLQLIDITSERLHIVDSYFNISHFHQGLQIFSMIVVLDRLHLDTIENYSSSLFRSFILMTAHSVRISQCKFMSRFMIFIILELQNREVSNFQLINSYIYIPGTNDLETSSMRLANFYQVLISNNTFIGTAPQITLSALIIQQTQRTLINDCKISQMSNFLILKQRHHLSQVKITNLSYTSSFQHNYFNKVCFIEILQGMVIFENIDISIYVDPIILNSIAGVLINKFSAQSMKIYQPLLQILSTYKDFKMSIHNMTLKNISLIYEIPKQFSLISIRSDHLIFYSSGLTIKDIRVYDQLTNIIQITSVSQKTQIVNLHLFDSECQQSCFTLQQLIGNVDQVQLMDINIQASSFINNSAANLFTLQTQQNQQESSIIINNSIILSNKLRLASKLQQNQIIKIIDCDIAYNTLPIDQSQYYTQHSQAREYVSDIQILLSTDNGQQYAINRQLENRQYELKLKRGTSTSNLFYIPTGQYFRDFILFNYRTQNYQIMSIYLYFYIKNASSNACHISYLNITLDFQITNQNWNQFMIISKPKTVVEFNISCLILGETYSLVFLGKVLECQIGEILLNDKCLRCLPSKAQYSVKKYSSYCKPIDLLKMNEVYYGLINLRQGYWRPSIYIDLIEECNSYYSNCKGGYNIANKICMQGYIGAICADCDLNNEMGYGRFIKNSANKCEQCQYSSIDIIKFSIYVIIYNLFSSAYFILSNAKLFYKNSRLVKLSKVFKSKFVIYNVPADKITIYVQFILEYFQNLTITNNYSIAQLIPFIIRLNIFENVSFTYMNYVDCFLAPFFYQDYWIYNRLFFLLSCYIMILQTYLVIYLNFVKYKKIQYQLIMVFVPILSLYSNNILSFVTQIILLTIPIEYAQIYWIQTRVSHQYLTTIHKEGLALIITVQVSVMIIIPLVIYGILLSRRFNNIKSQLAQSFTYLVYQYKIEYQLMNYIIKMNSLALIIVVYAFQRQVNIRIFLLIVLAVFTSSMFNKFQIYKYQVVNKLIVQLQLLFMSQLIISGLIESAQEWLIQQLFKLIYYSLSIIITFMVFQKAIPEIDVDNIQWTDKIRSCLGLQLRFYKIKQIRQRFQWINSNLQFIIDHNHN